VPVNTKKKGKGRNRASRGALITIISVGGGSNVTVMKDGVEVETLTESLDSVGKSSFEFQLGDAKTSYEIDIDRGSKKNTPDELATTDIPYAVIIDVE